MCLPLLFERVGTCPTKIGGKDLARLVALPFFDSVPAKIVSPKKGEAYEGNAACNC